MYKVGYNVRGSITVSCPVEATGYQSLQALCFGWGLQWVVARSQQSRDPSAAPWELPAH